MYVARPLVFFEVSVSHPILCHELAIRLAWKLLLAPFKKLGRNRILQRTHSHHNTAYTNIWTQPFPNPCALPEDTEDSVKSRR